MRAVSRDPHGKVTDIADTWPLNAATVEDAKAEVDRQHWREPGDLANAFETSHDQGVRDPAGSLPPRRTTTRRARPLPVIQLTFHEVEQIEVSGEDGRETCWAWKRD